MLHFVETVQAPTEDKIVSLIPTITKGANRVSSPKTGMEGAYATQEAPINNPIDKGKRDTDLGSEKSYDFRDFLHAEDVDGYIATTFRLTVEQMLKNGFGFQGPDTELVDTIERKIKQILHASNTHLEEFLENMATGLTKFCNGMAVFVRQAPVQSQFKAYVHRGKNLNPIAGIFYVEPQHMNPKRESGKLKKWEYQNNDTGAEFKEFNPIDVFHSKWNRKGDHVFGTPWILPALDDVRLLRRLEEFVQMLISKHLFPLYQYKVGTEKAPAQVFEDGTSEIKKVRTEVGDLPTQGCVFTSYRHEIVAIGQSDAILDIKGYLEHFDKRALSSCGLSDIDIGRGNTANRGTATVMNQTRVDRCTRVQKILEADIREQIIIPLILALGKDPFLTENEVKLVFNEIDTQEKRTRELHDMQLFQNGLITHDETRTGLRKRPFTDPAEWDNTYQNTVQRITGDQSEQQATEATKQKALVSNKTAPANQTSKSAKPKVAKNA